MGTTRDTWPATWARMLKRFRREAEKMKQFGWEVTEPPNADQLPRRPASD